MDCFHSGRGPANYYERTLDMEVAMSVVLHCQKDAGTVLTILEQTPHKRVILDTYFSCLLATSSIGLFWFHCVSLSW